MTFIIYAMCPDCMVMHGPFASDAQRGQFYDQVHPGKCVGIKQVPKVHRQSSRRFGTRAGTSETKVSTTGETTTAPARTYVKGDFSPPFTSKFASSCYECGFATAEGDEIRMVTIRDGEKGKAVHDECLDDLLAALFHVEPQSDEPPF